MEMSIVEGEQQVEDGQRRFVVNIFAPEGKPVLVRSCEVQAARFRNRTSFTGTCGVEEVFEEKVAEGLRDCLARMTTDTKVLAMPEYVIETNGLILAGVHMMTTKAPDGMVSVILRFKLLIGGIQNAFHPDLKMDNPLADHQERLATLVLADIGLPLLNLCSTADEQLLSSAKLDQAFSRRIADRSHEIRFQIELVKRYVDALDRFDFTNRRPPEMSARTKWPAALSG